MKANREDMAQAALTVQRYCEEHFKNDGPCDCPFSICTERNYICRLAGVLYPKWGYLEIYLRTRGLDNGEV